jgi:HEAT repeat protein
MIIAWAGASIGSSAVESLFFARFGVTNLPAMYIVLGLITLPVTLGMSALLARPDPQRVLVAIPLALAGGTCVLRLLLALEGRWVYPVLWVSMMVAWIVLALDTWGLAGLGHDSRQAKRLFPLYGTGVILGGALGGLITPWLAGWLHVENLLLVWGLSLVGTWAAARSLPGRVPGRRRPRRVGSDPGPLARTREGARYVRHSTLLRRMSIAILLTTALYYTLSRTFAGAVTARFPSPDDLAGFLGLFSAATNLGALVLSLVVANWLLSRLGVAAGLVIMPAIYAAGFLCLVATGPEFATIVGFRFLQWTWMYGVWSVGWQALWSVIPSEHRQQARAFVDGGPTQWGVLVAGVALLLSERLLTDRTFFALSALAAVGAIAAAWSVKRAYRGALVDALRAGWPEVFAVEEEPFGGVITDPVARQALTEAANDPEPAIRRAATELLISVPGPEAGAAARRALGDPDPLVRVTGLRAVAGSDADAAVPQVLSLLSDPDPSVRAAAATAAALADRPGDMLLSSLRPLLADSDPDVRVRAAREMARVGHDPQAHRVLTDLATSEHPGDRARGITALGQLAMEFDLVAAGLHDAEPATRRASARALPAFGAGEAGPPLIDALADDDPTVRETVADALAGLGGDVAERVAPLLDDHRREATALAVLLRVPEPDLDVLGAYARTERDRALHYHQRWQAMGPTPHDTAVLLAAGLRHRALRHAEHAAHALAPGGDHETIDVALQNVTSPDASQRAYALETLEATSAPDLIRPLLVIWDPLPGVQPATAALLRSILSDDDPWIRACAAFASASFTDTDLRAAVRGMAAEDPDPMVRDAARAVSDDAPVETVPTLSLMERMLALQRAPLFRAISPEDLKHVAEALTENAYLDGTVIAAEGDPGDAMHVVVSGDIRVVRGKDQPVELANRGPGYIVGEMSILADQPRMADLIAVGDVRTVSIDRTRFLRILRERPDAALAIMRELSVRLLEADVGRANVSP